MSNPLKIDPAMFRAVAGEFARDNTAYVRAVRQMRSQAEFAEQWLGGPVEISDNQIELTETGYQVTITFRRARNAR